MSHSIAIVTSVALIIANALFIAWSLGKRAPARVRVR